MKKALNNKSYKQIGHVETREWNNTVGRFQKLHKLPAFDSAIRSATIGFLADKYGFGGNKIFRIGEPLSGAPIRLIDFYVIGDSMPMELFGLFDGVPFSCRLDGIVKIVEDTIRMFIFKSFGQTFTELGHAQYIWLSIWDKDELFLEKFTRLVEKIEKLMPPDKIVKLFQSSAPFYIYGRYMLLRENLLSAVGLDELKSFLSNNLADPLTNEHIKNVLYQEAKSLAVYGIEKYSADDKRLEAYDDYVDAIVEYL